MRELAFIERSICLRRERVVLEEGRVLRARRVDVDEVDVIVRLVAAHHRVRERAWLQVVDLREVSDLPLVARVVGETVGRRFAFSEHRDRLVAVDAFRGALQRVVEIAAELLRRVVGREDVDPPEDRGVHEREDDREEQDELRPQTEAELHLSSATCDPKIRSKPARSASPISTR